MAFDTALGWLQQKKHYAKYFTFMAVSGFLFLGYTLSMHLDVVAILPIISDKKGTAWKSKFLKLTKGNATVRSTPDDSSAKALSISTSMSPTPRDVTNDGMVNSTVGTLKAKWFITLDKQVGRMGNKMFEYASVLGIGMMTGRHVFVQESSDLSQIFQLTCVENMSTEGDWTVVEETQYAYFDPIFKKLPDGNIKISGYLQSWKYFDRIRSLIRKEFTLLPKIRSEVEMLKDEISQTLNKTDPVFIGVHVRQIDEKSTPNTLEAPRSYFMNAFSLMRSLLAGYELVFLVAGNRLDWCQANLNESDVYVLPPMSAEMHFAALSSCDHAILSVGSYGWWIAWLTGGQVTFYKKFPKPDSYEYKGFVYGDYYPPHWIPVDD